MPKRTTIFLLFALLILSACSATAAPTLPPDLTDATWHLTNLADESPIVQGQALALTFDPASGKIAGFGGCNRFFGSYHLSGDGQMSLDQLGSTLMACAADEMMTQEQHFFSLLQEVASYRLTADTLTLQTATGEALVFVRS